MTGKEQFEKAKEVVGYILKDDEWYRLIYFDAENNICRYKKTKRHMELNDENAKTYEEACKLYTIDIVENAPTPDQYFLIKIQEKDNDMRKTISNKILIGYLKEHKEECPDAVEKLKEIVRTNGKRKIRKAAYETCVAIEAEGIEDLKTFIDHPELKEERTNIKPKRTNVKHIGRLEEEKAILVYMELVRQYKNNRDEIKCRVFLNQWDDMFSCDACGEMKDMQIRAFKYVRSNFDKKSLEEIQNYRNTLIIYEGSEIPVEIKKLAMEKSVIVSLAENRNKHLSGFDILIKQGRNQTFRLPKATPFGLNENELKMKLRNLPTKKELLEKEKQLKNMLNDTSMKNHQKVLAVSKYKAPYATHNFKVFMNRFTIYECKDKELTNACVILCNKVGINNLSNEKPILYKYCAGSGQREKSMKKVKNCRKGNTKRLRKGN